MVLLEGGGAGLNEVLSIASQPNHADVTLVCQGGSIQTSTFVLRMISPLLSTLFGESSSPSHLLLPDLQLASLHLLLSSLSECQPTKDKIQSLIPTLTTLGAFLPSAPPALDTASVAAATSPSMSCFPLRSSQPYFKDIPDLPDIQSTELFDPEYLEDVEIEEEENLSLTIIHSAQQRLVEGSTAAVKRKQRRKGMPRPRRVRVSSEWEKEAKKEGKKLEAGENGHKAATQERLQGHTRCFLMFMLLWI